jgi:flagellar motor switch protein FliG
MAGSKSSNSSYTGVQKASILLMTIDEDVASKVFSMMTEDEIRDISHSMSGLGKVDQGEVESLIKEFSEEISGGKNIIGDINNAHKILSKALGADKVASILGDISSPMGKDTWDKLNNVSEELLASYLKNEHPQTVALILSKIRTSHASKVLSIMPEEFTFEVIRRMINLEPVKREVLSDIEKILQMEFMANLSTKKESDGFELMAEIFNNFDRATESKFFDLLDKKEPALSEKIRELMFTFEDLLKIDGAGVQVILRNADKEKLPIALKGASEEIKDLFFKNMSERAVKILKEEIESLGPVRISDVDEAQMSIVNTAKKLADSGEITIPEGDEGEEQLIY